MYFYITINCESDIYTYDPSVAGRFDVDYWQVEPRGEGDQEIRCAFIAGESNLTCESDRLSNPNSEFELTYSIDHFKKNQINSGEAFNFTADLNIVKVDFIQE